MLPEFTKVKLLEQKHEDYKHFEPTWRIIQDIREGAIAIQKKIRDYLPKRPGEEENLYQLRYLKASWTPVMATAIREFTSKLTSAPVYITGDDSDFWKKFRENTNAKGRDEPELLTNIFSSLLYFGRLFVMVDRPALGIAPRSLYEESGLDNLPYVSIFEPLLVPNWGDGWYMTRQVEAVSEPLKDPKMVATWIFWDAEAITTYEAEVRLNTEGAIYEVKVGSRWLTPDAKDCVVYQKVRVEHGLGVVPVAHLELPSELWTGNNVYLKQLQHFRIESSWTDAGTMAGVIQRVFTPAPPSPANDERVVYEEPDYSQIKTGNQHVLIGSDFKFTESSGSAISNLTSQLETIERQIRAIVSMSQASVDTAALQQSGASKAVDREPLEDAMKAYGTKVAKFYQDILQLVGLTASQPEDIAVAGLDNYGVDTLGDMLEQTTLLAQMADKIPPTALRIWFGKVSNLMVGSRDSETDQQLQDELDAIDFSVTTEEDSEEDVMVDMGLTREELDYILNG